MLLTVRHTTRYTFAEGLSHGLQRLRLKPKPGCGQEVLDWRMDLVDAWPEVHYDDQHQNHVDLVSIGAGVPEVVVTCEGTVRTRDNNGIVGPHIGYMPLWYFLRPTTLTRPGPSLRALLASVTVDRGDPLGFLHALSAAVAEAVEYVPGATDVTTPAEQALVTGKGVCQDHAHIFIAAGRLADVPMRYVGGYLRMDEKVEQEAGHGWAEAHVPGLGWVGFDVSNAICPDERYIRVATGCDYGEAAPVTGMAMGAGATRLDVQLSVDEKTGAQQQQQSGDGQQQQVQGG